MSRGTTSGSVSPAFTNAEVEPSLASDPQHPNRLIAVYQQDRYHSGGARGIVAARDDLGIKLPLVVRMTGTAEEEGRKILSEAGITPGVSAPEAAAKAVELARGGVPA